MFGAVNAYRRRQHKYNNDKHRRSDSLALFQKNGLYDIERIALCVDAEQVEYPDHSEHPEYNEPREVEKRQYRKQLDQTVQREDVHHHSFRLAHRGIKQVGSRQPQHILDDKKDNGHVLHGCEHRLEGVQRGECLQKHRSDIKDDIESQHDIKDQAGKVIPVVYLHYLKDPFSHSLTSRYLQTTPLRNSGGMCYQ